MQSIYGLTDPWDELVHYVGRAQDVHRRYAQHLVRPHNNAEKNDWMTTIKDAGRVPGLVVFEQDIEDDIAPEREMHWIGYYIQQGAPLTNIVLPSERKPRAMKVPRKQRPEKVIVRPSQIEVVIQPGQAKSPSDQPHYTYRQAYTKCGKSRCKKCHMGDGHGPYLYAYWSEKGRTRSRYIGKILTTSIQ